MQRKVYRTTVKPEFREQYIEAHKNVATGLLQRYRQAGMCACEVYLLDYDLVMIVECEDAERLGRILAEDPVDREWQQFVGPMKADGDWQEMQEIFHADLDVAIPEKTEFLPTSA